MVMIPAIQAPGFRGSQWPNVPMQQLHGRVLPWSPHPYSMGCGKGMKGGAGMPGNPIPASIVWRYMGKL